MGIREKLGQKPALGAVGALVLLLIAGILVAKTFWPEKKGDLLQAFYSDDDGQSWFADSIYRVAPFDHNGKIAVQAQVYTYDDGKKQFCGYLCEFAPQAKTQLEAALADAQRRGQAPGTVSLYQNRDFMEQTLVKLPGSGHPWVHSNDASGREVRTVHSPDGSQLDMLVVQN